METAEQATPLAELGCDAVQGYYFGRPAPLEAPVSADEPKAPRGLTA